MEKQEEKEAVGDGVQYRLMIPTELHTELKEVCAKTGISMKQIILDGIRFRCKDVKNMFKGNTASNYRNM